MRHKQKKPARPTGTKPKRSRPGQKQQAPGQRRKETSFQLKRADSILLYGRNSVEAALNNPERECLRLIATKRGLEGLERQNSDPDLPVTMIEDPADLAAFMPPEAPHQGIFLEVRPLPGYALEDLAPIDGRKNIILVLDQVTDPHNVGACLRSAAAFGARAMITQDRNSPSESGALARASAGGLEVTPWVRAANIAQALEALKDMGYWHIGLDGHTDASIKNADLGDNVAIVMGSEGKGLRPLVRKHCDLIARIPMRGDIESLNVSNAAAIALYALS